MSANPHIVNRILHRVGFHVGRHSRAPRGSGDLGLRLGRLLESSGGQERDDLLRFLSTLSDFRARETLPRGQVLQDVFAQSWAGPRPFFVDCGAGPPERLSNTFALQESFGWSGLLIEPNPTFVAQLAERKSERVKLVPVAAGSPGSVQFLTLGELSCATDRMRGDWAANVRQRALKPELLISVDRVPLGDLLEQYVGPPRQLDFLSLDVEGAEEDVLASLDLGRWSFRAIAVENADLPDLTERVDHLMKRNSYRRVLATVSAFDSWYVRD